MAKCFFDNDDSKIYECEYTIKKYGIEVIVNYDIGDEIEPDINGARILSTNTDFKDRDILIIDHDNRKNYLLKKAYYSGHSSVWGTLDGGVKTHFNSRIYFFHNNYKKLCELKETPKTNKIRIYCNLINELIGHPSLFEEVIDNELVIKLRKNTMKKIINIDKNNIKEIVLSDDWSHVHNYKNNDISIELTGYLEIILHKRVNYDNIYDYVREAMTYLQLIKPDKLIVDKVELLIDNEYFNYNIPIDIVDYCGRYIRNSVSDDVTSFLSKCYNLIPYRNSSSEIKNISTIVFEKHTNIEDNFLLFYRFIECYYKKQRINGIVNSFISYSITNNYKNSVKLNNVDIERLSQEIICLRDHYVHSGYFLKNNCLRIKFKKRKQKIQDYTVNNVDVKWIYDRTKILYEIVVDIIFKNMLGYNQYKFEKYF